MGTASASTRKARDAKARTECGYIHEIVGKPSG